MNRHGNRKAIPRPWQALLCLVLVGALGACRLESPPALHFVTPTLDLAGFTQANFSVEANTAWTLDVVPEDPTLANAISTDPLSGQGDSAAVVIVDAAAMPREGARFRLRLTATQSGKLYQQLSDWFTFEYPSVTGSVTGGPGPSSLSAQATSGVTSAAFSPSSSPALAGAPETTLMVGIEPRGAVLGTAAAADAFGAAQLQVSSTVAALGVRASAEPFEEAGLTFVTVPTADAVRVAEELRATPGVSYVDFPLPLYPSSNDPLRGLQWNLDQLAVEPLWAAAGGAGVTVAVLDQGFYPNHPDLYPNVVGTYDAAVRGPMHAPVAACGSHGTHVAGITAAVANNGIGVAGVAPYAKLLLVDLAAVSGSACEMNTTALAEALRYIVNGGSPRAQVINMSLGAAGDLGSGVRNAISAASAAGISLVAAAGNDKTACPAPTTKAITYPAAYPEVLAVAATGPDGLRPCYSQIGPQMFVAAPGGGLQEDSGVLSTVVTFPAGLVTADYGLMSGTSMASPAVAGVIAMLRSAAPAVTAAQIEAAIAATAIDKGAPGRDPEYGYGLIDAGAAYDYLLGSPPPPPEPVLELLLRVPGYPDALLDDDGLFTLLQAAPGLMTIEVGTDDNGNGVLGEPGEWYGRQTVDVEFGVFAPAPGNRVSITVVQVP